MGPWLLFQLLEVIKKCRILLKIENFWDFWKKCENIYSSQLQNMFRNSEIFSIEVYYSTKKHGAKIFIMSF